MKAKMFTKAGAPQPGDDHASPTLFPAGRRMLACEIVIVLLVTFGTSGVRSGLRLIAALLSPTPLNHQKVVLNGPQARQSWLDICLQMTSAAVLVGWGLLVVYLLVLTGTRLRRARARDAAAAAALAATIGIPGLAFYAAALHLGLTKTVVPAQFDGAWYQLPVLTLWSFANAFAEETVVVAWFVTRLEQLKAPTWVAVLLAAVLRGSYHLYQGISAGFGNIIMGVVFGTYYARTRRVWPLVFAHFAIDTVAFIGPVILAGHLRWIGL